MQANSTFLAMARLRNLFKGVDDSIKQLRREGEFRRKFLNIVELAQSPFVQMIMDNYNVNPKVLNAIFEGLLHDKQVADIIETAGNIFECFSVDRFIGVETELELEQMAMKLNEKKLFFGGVYFKNNGYDKDKEFSYTLRMDIDNTPVTLENRNRFWFPGPNGNFELEMRYHRGFIEIQHIIDQAIIQTATDVENKIREENYLRTTTTTMATTTMADDLSINTEPVVNKLDANSPKNETTENENIQMTTDPSVTTIPTESTMTTTDESTIDTTTDNKDISLLGLAGAQTAQQLALQATILRRKRDVDFSALLNGPADQEEDDEQFPGNIIFGKMFTYTKQFPYPKYHKDNFLKGLYLAQALQLVFFFALIVQVTSAVRNRIWMKESGNSTVSVRFYLHF